LPADHDERAMPLRVAWRLVYTIEFPSPHTASFFRGIVDWRLTAKHIQRFTIQIICIGVD
jgi:hypothetical protein